MRTLLTSALCAALLSCGPGVAWAAPAPDAADTSKPATGHTRAAHAAMSKEVDFADRQDFQDAQRGFLAPLPDRGRILDANGRETWNLAPYDFLAPAMSRDFPPSVIMPTQAPDTVNPSLWRQSQLVLRDGLYKVVDRLYQIRNADLSNMTIIEGDSGTGKEMFAQAIHNEGPRRNGPFIAVDCGALPRGLRWWPSSIPTAMWTITAACTAWWMKKTWPPARCGSSRPRASWKRPWPRTCWPAMP